mmetsp:Transcript_5848/g.14413  ORF Transcript_5848/g.14413 Transcript_5848/m.14413 type:complete len:183 (+) Transcript_5848:739-1287(+)
MRKHAGQQCGMAMIVRQRGREGDMELVGSVDGADCIIVDEIVASGERICEVAAFLKKRGAKRVFGFATHCLIRGQQNSSQAVSKAVPLLGPLHSGSRRESVHTDLLTGNCDLEELVVTDSAPLSAEAARIPLLKQITLAPLLAEVIKRLQCHGTLLDLFELNPGQNTWSKSPELGLRKKDKT